MDIPNELWRFPTAKAIASLSARFRFVSDDLMQDPEAELSDPNRIPEFVETYENALLTDDERFLLMGIILNSFEFSEIELTSQPQWNQVLQLLERTFEINQYHVLYFAQAGTDCRIGPYMRSLSKRHSMSPSDGSAA